MVMILTAQFTPANDTRHFYTVRAAFHRIVLSLGIPAAHVVNVAIAVVVNAVIRNFVSVEPKIILQVGVCEADAVVNHRDYYGVTVCCHAAACDVPCFVSVNISVGSAACLSCVAVHPLIRKNWVVGYSAVF
jgi:hypothetical protein